MHFFADDQKAERISVFIAAALQSSGRGLLEGELTTVAQGIDASSAQFRIQARSYFLSQDRTMFQRLDKTSLLVKI